MKKISICIFICVFTLTGCAATTRRSPDFKPAIRRTRNIAVMPIDIKMYQLQAGGTTELMDEWTSTVRDSVQESLQRQLSQDSDFALTFLSKDTLIREQGELWREYRVLYETVLTNILRHAFSETAFVSKVRNFDYSLGPGISKLTQPMNAEVLCFIYGSNFIRTTGRKFVMATNFVTIATLGVLLPPVGLNTVTIAMVDAKSGRVLWFKRTPPGTGFNLLESDQTEKIIQWMLKDFLTAE